MDIINLSDDYTEFSDVVYESVSGNPKILSKVVGSFFVPNGHSRNDRFYSESLWKKVLESSVIKQSLNDGMLGTLVHPESDKMAHPIYSSHVIKKLWIDGRKRGMGEAYLLDTPVGRIVDTFQQSKLVKMYVSSRAWGQLKKSESKNVVDEDNYVLETFDFVLQPGFLEASPEFSKTMEQLTECYIYSGVSKRQRTTKIDNLLKDIDLIRRGEY
jgi:hypothetical protein